MTSVCLSVMSLYSEVNDDVCSLQGNHTELCKECKSTYRGLNELYGRMEMNKSMCIDIEDSVCMSGSYRGPLLRWEERTLRPLEESVQTEGRLEGSSPTR